MSHRAHALLSKRKLIEYLDILMAIYAIKKTYIIVHVTDYAKDAMSTVLMAITPYR